MSKISSFVVVAILLFSCGGEEVSNEELVDFEDFAGETGVEDEDSTVIDTTVIVDNSPVGQLAQKLIADYDTSAHDEYNTLDRFGFNNQRKVLFTGKHKVPYGKSSEVTPLAEFYYYSFTDTVKTKNAFYNYLDGLAVEGEGGHVKLNQDVESIKMPPLFMVVYDTLIISAVYKCEHEKNNWEAFEDSIFSIFGKDYRYYIDVECGGPLKWK